MQLADDAKSTGRASGACRWHGV